MASQQRLVILQRALEDAGMIARSYSPPDQLIELQVMHHPEQKEKYNPTEKSCCAMISQMIHQLFKK